jgi:hypothetical protein
MIKLWGGTPRIYVLFAGLTGRWNKVCQVGLGTDPPRLNFHGNMGFHTATDRKERKMKRVRAALLFSMILLSLLVSGCKWSIVSVTGPSCVSDGQTITIYLEGSCESEEEAPNLYGLILQIPDSWDVLSASATVGSYSYDLTEDTQYTHLYKPERGYKVWIGTTTEPQDEAQDGSATVYISVGGCSGQVQIKAAAGSLRNGEWTTDDPAGKFNFAEITEQKYSHSIGCCSWRRQSPPSPLSDLQSVWGSSDSNVFAVGVGGTILHYDGTSWSSMDSGTTNNLNSVWGSSGNNVFAVGASGTILYYDGASWSSMDSGTTSNLNGVWGKPGFGVLAVGDSQNTILQYIGDMWTSTTLPDYCSSQELFAVWGIAENDVFAVGNYRSFFHYNGSYWNCTQLYGGDMYAIWGSSASDVFAVGAYLGEFWENHPIAHYDGTSWNSMPNNTTNSLHGVWGSSDSDVFAVGTNGTILHYGGLSWTAMISDTTNTLTGIWGGSSSDVFAVGAKGTILHYGPPIALYVNADGQCDGFSPCYSSIGEAMEAAIDGDTILAAKTLAPEEPIWTKTGTVTISGGWKTDFSDKDGTTSIYAPRATGGGGVKVEPNVKIIPEP